MEIRCPHCAFPMVLAGIRPGHFTPRCQRCHAKFALAVPPGDGPVPVVHKLPDDAAHATATGGTAVGVTAAPAAPPATAAATATLAPPVTRTVAPTALPTAAPSSHRSAAVTATAATADHHAHRTAAAPLAAPVTVDDELPAVLGGYQVTRPLGQGGMGAVFLARQLSLDRNVALKVLSPRLADDASFVARFTREAYAAAQLSHHNVVQVFDIGDDAGRHFYAMEYVPGQTLAGLVKHNGPVDPAAAVGYALQAARGLKFAHDQGLIHRDVKPDNLMLNDQGIVKVADLGLVKKRGTADVRPVTASHPPTAKLDQAQSANATGFDMSMGTPAYMAPEQAKDAAAVDARADVYSLGCTLYDLLTGRPPFAGATALEVITKHATEPVTPPEAVVKRVPAELSALLMRMVAKRPDDRPADMGQCIREMEEFLGTTTSDGAGGPFVPKQNHIVAIETAAGVFRNGPLATVRRFVVPGFFAACAAAAVLGGLSGPTLAARVSRVGTSVGLAVLTAAAYLVVAGVTRRHEAFVRGRQYVAGASWADWAKAAAAVAGLVAALVVFHLIWAWVAVAVAAVAIAAGLCFGLDAARDRERQSVLDRAEEMLRSMRLKGMDEDALRQFVCRYSGNHWEEFYEALFGYEAKLSARRRWGLSLRGKSRPKFAPWRDGIIATVDARNAARQRAREQKVLAHAEVRRLEAEGMDAMQARRKAARRAQRLVDKAALLQQALDDAQLEADRRAAGTAGPTTAARHAVRRPSAPADLFADADTDDETVPVPRVRQTPVQLMHGGPLGFIFGPAVRFPIAAALLAGFFLWFHQAHPDFPRNAGVLAQQSIDQAHATLSGRQVERTITSPVTPVTAAAVSPSVAAAQDRVNADPPPADLDLPAVPPAVRHAASGFTAGLAGALLLLSCLSRGWRAGVLALACAAVIVTGEAYLPTVGPVTPQAAAASLGVVGWFLGQSWTRG